MILTWRACDTHMTCMWYPCGVHVMHTFGAFYHLPHYMRLYEIMRGAYNNYKVSTCDTHMTCMWYPCGVHVMHTFGAFFHLSHYMRLYEIMGGAYNNYKVSYMRYSHDMHVIPMWCTCDAHIWSILSSAALYEAIWNNERSLQQLQG